MKFEMTEIKGSYGAAVYASIAYFRLAEELAAYGAASFSSRDKLTLVWALDTHTRRFAEIFNQVDAVRCAVIVAWFKGYHGQELGFGHLSKDELQIVSFCYDSGRYQRENPNGFRPSGELLCDAGVASVALEQLLTGCRISAPISIP